MPKKSCPIIAVYSPYKNGQDFLAIQYALGGLVPAIEINMKQGRTVHRSKVMKKIRKEANRNIDNINMTKHGQKVYNYS